MPSVITLRHANIREAEYLADLYGIDFDLQEASRTCEAVIKLADDKSVDSLLISSAVSGAVVQYQRAFTTGVRFRLTKEIFKNSGAEHGDFHDYVDSVRDKFLAHPVNAFEESFVTVGARVTDGVQTPIEGVSPGKVTRLLGVALARDLILLIAHVRKKVDGLIQAEQEILLRHIQTLPLEDVHSWPMFDSTSRLHNNPEKRRARFQPKKGGRRRVTP